jgi:hypothetical protein
MKEKLTSRKLWVAIIGMLIGVVMIFAGNATEGVAAVISSVLTYIIAEGYIDAKAVGAIIDSVEENLDELPE